MLGLGKAKAITQLDIWEIAQSIKVDPAVIDGIGITESNGAGWFPNGQLKILPEPHKFFEYLPKNKRAQALKAGLATRTYKETKESGHYKRMTNGPGPRYALLEKWIAFDENAAYMAISSGSFQIMGFNHDVCGFATAKQMFNAFCESEAVQLRAMINYIKSRDGGISALRSENFTLIEELYNGGGQNGAYAREMAKNTAKARKGRWANWHPSDAPHTTQTPKSSPVKELKKGDVSQEVEAVQNRLIVWGENIQPDGKYGKLTEEAVKNFQSVAGLQVTGTVNEETRKALFQNPNKVEEKSIEEDIKPVVVTETTTKLEPVVPKSVKKPFWKSWSVGGIFTMIGGWFTSLITDLEPWMKFTLLLIGIAIGLLIVWQRQRVFDEAKDLINRVQEFNNNAEPEVSISDPAKTP